jgi:lysophospholipase L1-like esterase
VKECVFTIVFVVIFASSCKKESFTFTSPVEVEPAASDVVLNTGIYKNSISQITLRWATNDKTLTNAPRVVGLGSSTLAGYRLAYPYRLGDKISLWLTRNTTRPTWINKATYGNNSVKTLPVSLGGVTGQNIETALSLNPDFIFLSLPSNDPATGIPVKVTLANLRKIDSIALSKGVPVFFETTQPRNTSNINIQIALKQLADSIRKIWPKRYVEGFNKLVDRNASTPSKLLPRYDSGDGIHVTSEGNQFIANSLFRTWQNYFKPVTGVSKYIIETSTDRINWKQFDVINSGNTVKKVYNISSSTVRYYRVRSLYENGIYSKYSNIAY